MLGRIVIDDADQLGAPSSPVTLLALERLDRRQDSFDLLLVGYVTSLRLRVGERSGMSPEGNVYPARARIASAA